MRAEHFAEYIRTLMLLGISSIEVRANMVRIASDNDQTLANIQRYAKAEGAHMAMYDGNAIIARF
jgi:hypothetical protein